VPYVLTDTTATDAIVIPAIQPVVTPDDPDAFEATISRTEARSGWARVEADQVSSGSHLRTARFVT
jgi:hypothetical protein